MAREVVPTLRGERKRLRFELQELEARIQALETLLRVEGNFSQQSDAEEISESPTDSQAEKKLVADYVAEVVGQTPHKAETLREAIKQLYGIEFGISSIYRALQTGPYENSQGLWYRKISQ